MRKIILASASPRRRELLAAAGVIFQVCAADGEEKITSDKPEEIVRELSEQKATAVALNFDMEEGTVVIGADTIVSYNNEILGIIGPNGSGKSTFLKCVYRTLKPDEGKITIDGKLIDELSYRDTASKMAVVAQHNIYNFDFKVIDIVLMGACSL